MNTYTLRATAASAVNDGATATANGATIVIGGAAPNTHAHLRFDTSVIDELEIVVQADLTAKVSALGAGSVPDILVWASEFGAAITIADYGIAANNTPSSPIRAQITSASNPFLDSANIVGDVGSQPVPTRFVLKDTGAFSDFELRPETATVGATDNITIHGAGAVTATDKPTLTILTLSVAEMSATNPFRWQAIGAQSFFAFAREPNEGVAVKACNILDASSIGISQNVQNLQGTGLSSNRVKPRKSTYGGATAGGSVSFDLTPEKCMQLLTGVLKIVQTTGPDGDGLYTHTFKVAESQEVASFTGVTKKGAFYQVYPGLKISRMNVSIGLDSIVTASIDCMALQEWKYDYTSAGTDGEYILDDAAAYDTTANGLWSFADGSVSVGSQAGDFIQSFSIDFSNDLRPRRGLNRKREAVAHFPLGFQVTAGFSMYFENELVLRKFFGASAQGYPFKARKKLELDTISFSLEREDIGHTLTFSIPKVLYETVNDSIQGEDAIMLEVQSVANYDESTASNVVVTLVTLEPAASFEPSSNTITIQPALDPV